MKNYPILKFYRLVMIIPVVLALFSLFSCQQDESYSSRIPPGSTLVNLSVSASNNNVTQVANDPASAINTLCILQFNANGNDFGTLRHVGIGTKSSTGRFTATLLQSNGSEKYKLVVLANLPDNSYRTLQSMANDKSTTYDRVQSALLSEVSETKLVFDGSTPFPMFGLIKNGDPLSINASQDFSEATSLIRAVARVDIGVGTKNANNEWVKGDVKFLLKQIYFFKQLKQYAYMPGAGTFHSAGGVLTIDSPSPPPGAEVVEMITYPEDYIKGHYAYCEDKIYVPETLLSWGKPYDPLHDQRAAIVVRGRYANAKIDTYYRLDFIDDNNLSKKVDILRNNVYQFAIKSVSDIGYDTPEEAYVAKPQGLTFGTSIADWQIGLGSAVPSPQEGYIMSYEAQNGTVTSGEGITLVKKGTGWTGENADSLVVVDYNTFYGEVPGNLRRPPAFPNGDIYPTMDLLASVEGVYPSLMVSTDDVYSVTGASSVRWKEDSKFPAFDICRSYMGLGYSDWRLPRASELALMFFNRKSLEKQRGFSAFSGTYWSGSEKDDDPKKAVATEAWTVSFDDFPHFKGAEKTTATCKVRCVRQIKNE